MKDGRRSYTGFNGYRLLALLRGSTLLLLICISTVFWCIPLYLFACIRLAVPARIKIWCTKGAMSIAECWIGCNNFFLDLSGVLALNISGLDEASRLSCDKWYLVFCNHQSGVDILILQYVFNHRIPMLKFFVKQSLMYVPMLGFAWWALDFPVMKRYSKALLAKHPEWQSVDLATTRRACKRFQLTPISVLSFPEGTRFTIDKHQAQGAKYQRLLKPKVGGAALVIGALDKQIDSLIDVTIHYTKPMPTLFGFLCGTVGQIDVAVKQCLIPSHLSFTEYEHDPVAKQEIQNWLNDIWWEKDQALQQLSTRKTKPQNLAVTDSQVG